MLNHFAGQERPSIVQRARTNPVHTILLRSEVLFHKAHFRPPVVRSIHVGPLSLHHIFKAQGFPSPTANVPSSIAYSLPAGRLPTLPCHRSRDSSVRRTPPCCFTPVATGVLAPSRRRDSSLLQCFCFIHHVRTSVFVLLFHKYP